ncbi:protein vav isoform X2 [Culicoides brevitarsis]|uniref:protein vav isoform X2 n=1 Tax=Culicoides brevitarsis TaxID=469753 RepID=UPI00307C36CC
MATNEDLWRLCTDWLTRCKVIPPEHKANAPESEIKVLAMVLRDGVLLCSLLTVLDPTIEIKSFHRKPQMAQFLCFHNISIFLEACRTHFNLKESDLFEPSMLYDLTNFHQVLNCLSKLSLCRKVQQLNPELDGFSSQIGHADRNHSDEEIYKDLHSTTTENAICNGHEEHTTKEEEVYQDLCSIQNLTRFQLSASTVSCEQRDFVVRELLDTEANYLEVLKALNFKFMGPLEKLLSQEELSTIFFCVKDLADIHSKFLERLNDSVISKGKTKLSQVFLDFREPFLKYGKYCSNLSAATDLLRDVCKRSSTVEQMVLQCQKEHSGGKVQLRDILSVPMQRILKYHLLLDKLVHETLPTHDDYRGLERAKEAMVDVAQYTNEVKRDSEHLAIIQKVKESILDLNLPNGNDLEQYGHLLLDGELHIKAHEDQKTKNRYAFIFEKLMILVKNTNTKVGEAQYTFREAHNLIDYRVETCAPTRRRDPRFKYQLLLARKSQSTAFTLYMKQETERNKWNKALHEAFDNLEPPGCRNTDHQFQLSTLERPISCWHCSKFLKGLIHQGYICKVCGIGVHKGCISSTGRCKQNMAQPPPICDRVLSEFYWFVGNMDRDTATMKLSTRKVGTYLLRVRPQGASHSDETMYALSLKTDDNVVKHMKIYQENVGECVLYLLSKRRQFKTIVELVSFYERNDLGENFAGLNQTLQWPYKEISATALFDFLPTESNQLELRRGCHLIVIGKEGDSKGWWRGRVNSKVGFFPKEYVRENTNVTNAL